MATGETSTLMALRDPDIRLMLRVRADDRAAFAEIVTAYQHRLVAVLHHVVGRRDEAEDLAQEVFLRVYQSRARYTPRAKFSTWLFTIANNLALNSLRNRKRHPTLPLESRDPAASGPVPTHHPGDHRDPPPAHHLDQEELAAAVRRALDGLQERQRVAVVLNKFEDMNYADIAEVMGLSTKAVKSLLSRARANLRQALRGYVDPDGDGDADDEGDDS
jgi:RNA polymerase sigma-70 factor (ECF subfamily)